MRSSETFAIGLSPEIGIYLRYSRSGRVSSRSTVGVSCARIRRMMPIRGYLAAFADSGSRKALLLQNASQPNTDGSRRPGLGQCRTAVCRMTLDPRPAQMLPLCAEHLAPSVRGSAYRSSHICTASSLLPVTLGDGLLGGAGIVWHEDLPALGQLAVPAWVSRTAERGCTVASQGASLPVIRGASRTTGEVAGSHR